MFLIYCIFSSNLPRFDLFPHAPGAFFGSIIVLEPCSILLGPGSVSCVAFGRLHDSREGSGVADGEFSIELFEGEMTLASGWSAKPPTLVAIPG